MIEITSKRTNLEDKFVFIVDEKYMEELIRLRIYCSNSLLLQEQAFILLETGQAKLIQIGLQMPTEVEIEEILLLKDEENADYQARKIEYHQRMRDIYGGKERNMKLNKPVCPENKVCWSAIKTEVPTGIMFEIRSQMKNSDKYKVYRDLYLQGYHLTDGCKFGGDYLVYLHDPSQCHSQYIVSRYNPKRMIDILSLTRVANQVNKVYILSSIDSSGNVNYITMKHQPFY